MSSCECFQKKKEIQEEREERTTKWMNFEYFVTIFSFVWHRSFNLFLFCSAFNLVHNIEYVEVVVVRTANIVITVLLIWMAQNENGPFSKLF